MYLIIVTLGILLICMIHNPHTQNGGSREAIFSRFSYQPEFPFISQSIITNLDRFSKTYNVAGNLKFIQGRPYRYYWTMDSNWAYPWTFPESIHTNCVQKASDHCNEPVQNIKTVTQKLNGLAVDSAKDIVRRSQCFDQIYSTCSKLS